MHLSLKIIGSTRSYAECYVCLAAVKMCELNKLVLDYDGTFIHKICTGASGVCLRVWIFRYPTHLS